MIVITGASGAYGGEVVEQLLRRVPADQVGVSVRDPATVQGLAERGVRVRRATYGEPDALRAAFEGADRVLLVSSNDTGGDPVAQHGSVIRAAKDAGVTRVLYSSHQNARPTTAFPPGRTHAATERLLADSGLAWTSLRNGFYAHSLAWMLGDWRGTGVIAAPADGPASWTSREEEAEAAAVLLASGSPVDGPVTLTADEAPTFADIAGVAAEVSGRPVERRVLADDEWVAQRVAAGAPEQQVGFLLTFFLAARAGDFDEVSPALGELLGRRPAKVRDLLAERVAA